mmetsp:Transcript_13816/g.33438  ORF Transcript_13816/g.33438 Transcript_13816/m.33438 type:complete len:556 (+) Transcript_13816:179-1846(+)
MQLRKRKDNEERSSDKTADRSPPGNKGEKSQSQNNEGKRAADDRASSSDESTDKSKKKKIAGKRECTGKNGPAAAGGNQSIKSPPDGDTSLPVLFVNSGITESEMSASGGEMKDEALEAVKPLPATDRPRRATLRKRKKAPRDTFHERLEELKQFKADHGHTNVPKNVEFKSLGRWVNNQRQYYKKREQGESSSLTEDRINSLEELGFIWSMNTPVSEKRAKTLQTQWEERLQELQEYKRDYGDLNVPLREGKYKELGKWVMNQRYYYKTRLEGQKNSLTLERIQDLDNIGFLWTIKGKREGDHFLSNEEKWKRNVKELTKFKEQFGHVNVIKSGKYTELGQFVANERYHYRRRLKGESNSLTMDRIKTLNDLGFEWKVRKRGAASKFDLSLKTQGDAQVVEKDKEINLTDGSTIDYTTKENSEKRFVVLSDGFCALETSTKIYTTKIEKIVLPPEEVLNAPDDIVINPDTRPPSLPGGKNVYNSENLMTYPDGSSVLRTLEESTEKRLIVLDSDSQLLEITTVTCITKIEKTRLPEESKIPIEMQSVAEPLAKV